MVIHKRVLCMGHLEREKEAGFLFLETYSIKKLLWNFCKMNLSNRKCDFNTSR